MHGFVLYNMNDQDPYIVRLRNGNQSEICIESIATQKLKSNLTILRLLVDDETLATHETPALPTAAIRIWLRKFILPAVKEIGYRSPYMNRWICTPLLNILYPPGWFFCPTLEEEIDWSWADAQKHLEDDSFTIACVDRKIVAICAFKLGGRLVNGLDVYEITKSYTLSEFRFSGLNQVLLKQTIQTIENRYPNALIMAMTKHKTVINVCKNFGWREISLKDYSEITQRIGRSGISSGTIRVFKHWKAFLMEKNSKVRF